MIKSTRHLPLSATGIFALGAIALTMALTGCTSTAAVPTTSKSTATAPVTVGTSTPSAVGNKTPTCVTSQLSGTRAPGAGAGMGGQQDNQIVLTNKSATACTLQGWPGTSLVTGPTGQQVSAPAILRRDTSHPTITLKAGGSATANFSLRTFVAHEMRASSCSPGSPTTVTGLRVYPPGQKKALFIPATYMVCSETKSGPGFAVSAFLPTPAP